MADEWLPEWFLPVLDLLSDEYRWVVFHPFYFRRISLLGIRDTKAVVFNLYCGRLVYSATTPPTAVIGDGLKGTSNLLKEFWKYLSSTHRVEGKVQFNKYAVQYTVTCEIYFWCCLFCFNSLTCWLYSLILFFHSVSLYSTFCSSEFQLSLNGPTVLCLLSLV